MPENRNPDGTFKQGTSGNPGGRPKDSLKSYVRRKFAEMTVEQKEEFLKSIPKEVIWKMGEGNPAQGVEAPDGAAIIVLPATLVTKNDSAPDAGGGGEGQA